MIVVVVVVVVSSRSSCGSSSGHSSSKIFNGPLKHLFYRLETLKSVLNKLWPV